MVNEGRSRPVKNMIYLDNNATTPLAPPVIAAMRETLENEFGNPSSAYKIGASAAQVIRTARESVAQLLGAADPSEIVFTSCGTESDNWAIRGALELRPGKRHIVTTAVEHDAVRKLCLQLEAEGCEVTWLEVNNDGLLDPQSVRDAVREETAVVSVMLANNETGVIFPVHEIGEIVKERSDALFHIDGVNAVGKVDIDLASSQIDLFALSAHKFHGPKGIGALYIRSGLQLPAMFVGGGQEKGRRPGTEAVHQIAGLGEAAAFVRDMQPMEGVARLRDKLENSILENVPNARVNGTRDPKHRLPNTSSISFENTNGELVLAMLDREGICVSTGSACHAGDHRASHVLQAMNIPYSWAMGSIRFSLSRMTAEEDVDRAIAVLPDVVARCRSFA